MSDSLVARTEFGNALGRLPRDNPHVIEVAPILRDLFDALLAERDTAVMERDRLRVVDHSLSEVSAELAAAEIGIDGLTACVARLRAALSHAMQYGIELGTADPEWVIEARAALDREAPR